MALERAVEILSDLVRFPSVSSTSNTEISRYVAGRLQQLSLKVEFQSYTDPQGVEKSNVIATAGGAGQAGPVSGLDSAINSGLVYCAHTDVVPANHWDYPDSPAFQLFPSGDRYYGRGSCDMKGSLACFLAVLETIPIENLKAPLSVLCTADEEVGFQGAMEVAARSEIYRQLVQQQPVALIGEPTLMQVVYAHKGIYVFQVTSRGIAAHSGTDQGVNANLKMIPFLQELWQIEQETRHAPDWQDTRFHPAGISWNIGINDFTSATNITPERSVATVSFRPMPGQPAEQLLDRARAKAEELGLEFELHHAAAAVSVAPEAEHIQQILRLAGQQTPQTVSYSTDACLLPQLQRTVIYGPGNIAQAHTSDEWISREQLLQGVTQYRKLMEHFCL